MPLFWGSHIKSIRFVETSFWILAVRLSVSHVCGMLILHRISVLSTAETPSRHLFVCHTRLPQTCGFPCGGFALTRTNCRFRNSFFFQRCKRFDTVQMSRKDSKSVLMYWFVKKKSEFYENISYVGNCLRYNILWRSGEYKYCKRVGDQQVLLSINRPQDARCPLLLHFETLGQPFPILSAQWENERLTKIYRINIQK